MNALTNIAGLIPAAGFILFILLILVNSYQLKIKGEQVWATGNNKSGSVKWIYPLIIAFLLLFLSEITRPLHGFSPLPELFTNCFFDSVLIMLTGVLAVFISIFVLITTLHHFGTSLRFGLSENNTGKLVTTGIFAKTRNPLFVSLLFFFTGTALIFSNLFFLVFALAAIAGIHLSILKEENFMHRFYGEEYNEYKRKVRRYF